MLIKQVHEKNVIFVALKTQKAMSFNDVAIGYVKGNVYRIYF